MHCVDNAFSGRYTVWGGFNPLIKHGCPVGERLCGLLVDVRVGGFCKPNFEAVLSHAVRGACVANISDVLERALC